MILQGEQRGGGIGGLFIEIDIAFLMHDVLFIIYIVAAVQVLADDLFNWSFSSSDFCRMHACGESLVDEYCHYLLLFWYLFWKNIQLISKNFSFPKKDATSVHFLIPKGVKRL